jgi:hypothetical protein
MRDGAVRVIQPAVQPSRRLYAASAVAAPELTVEIDA